MNLCKVHVYNNWILHRSHYDLWLYSVNKWVWAGVCIHPTGSSINIASHSAPIELFPLTQHGERVYIMQGYDGTQSSPGVSLFRYRAQRWHPEWSNCWSCVRWPSLGILEIVRKYWNRRQDCVCLQLEEYIQVQILILSWLWCGILPRKWRYHLSFTTAPRQRHLMRSPLIIMRVKLSWVFSDTINVVGAISCDKKRKCIKLSTNLIIFRVEV